MVRHRGDAGPVHPRPVDNAPTVGPDGEGEGEGAGLRRPAPACAGLR
jgi:hypothetical protein